MAVNIWWNEGKGQWAADIPQVSGKGRKRFYFGTHEAKARAQFHREMAKSYDGDQESFIEDGSDHASNHTVLDLAVAYLDWVKANRAPNTWRSYRDGIAPVTKAFAHKPCEELKPSDIEQVKQARQEDGLSA